MLRTSLNRSEVTQASPLRSFWLAIAILTFASPSHAQPAIVSPQPPVVPAADAAAIRQTLETAEKQHRDAYQASKFSEAIAAARGGLALADQAGTLADQLQFTRHLAYDYYLMGDNDSALDYCQRVLEAADRLNDDRVRSQGHRYLSQIYGTLGDDRRARAHAETALRFAKLSGDDDVRIYALTEVGLAEARARNYDAAIRLFEQCHNYWDAHKRPWNAANSLVNIAEVTEARGDLAGAWKRQEEILAARIKSNDLSGQARTVITIASLLQRLGRTDEALARLTAVRALVESVGSHRILASFYETLAQVQEARKEFSGAVVTERLAAAEREALAGERARLRAEDLEAKLESAQKQAYIQQLVRTMSRREAQIQLLETERADNATMRRALFAGLGFSALLVVIIVAMYFQLRRSRRLLARTEERSVA